MTSIRVPTSDGAAPTLRIQGALPHLKPTMRRVADEILRDPERASRLTISELARSSLTSDATVLRLSRELGYTGYTALRIALASESGARSVNDSTGPTTDIDPDDDVRTVIRKVITQDIQSLEETAQVVDVNQLSAAVALLASARRIAIFGVGASQFVGLDFQLKLHRIGRVSHAWPDLHMALTDAALLTDADVYFGVSNSGETPETIEVLDQAKQNGAATIALTSAPLSRLASSADVTILTASRETAFRSSASSSRIAQLSVIDILFVAIAQVSYKKSMRALDATRTAIDAHRDRRV